RTALRRQIPIAGAQCGNPARWDLRGGPPARAVPTATLSRLGTPGGRLGGALAFLESLAVFGHDDFGELLDRSIRAALVQGDPPALKQVHPVADVEDLAVVVRDDDDRQAAVFLEPAHQVEDHRAFLDAHRGQRLVEQQDLGVGVDRPGYRDGLALATGQHRYLGVDRRDVDADLVQVLPGQLAHHPGAQQRDRPGNRLPVQEHVLVHRELVDQRQVLVHHVDAGRPGLLHRVPRDLVALQVHGPRGGRLEAADDLDKGGLTRPVVTEQAEDLTAAKPEADVPQRGDRAVALGDVLDPQDVASGLG